MTKKINIVLILSVSISCFLLFANIFSYTPIWSLMEVFTKNYNFNIYFLYLLIVLISIVYIFFTIRKKRLLAFIPFLINLISIILLIFIPFKDMNLKKDIENNFNKRNIIVKKVKQGELIADSRDRILLPFQYQYLSKGGGEILARQENGIFYLFFYTFRGVLDNFSGLLYVSDDKLPKKNIFGSDTKQLIKIRENWYWLASW